MEEQRIDMQRKSDVAVRNAVQRNSYVVKGSETQGRRKEQRCNGRARYGEDQQRRRIAGGSYGKEKCCFASATESQWLDEICSGKA